MTTRVSEMTRQIWLDIILAWAEDRLPPPQFDECKLALSQGNLADHDRITALEKEVIEAKQVADAMRDLRDLARNQLNFFQGTESIGLAQMTKRAADAETALKAERERAERLLPDSEQAVLRAGALANELQQLKDRIREADGLAVKETGPDGFITAYHFNTGTWHRLLGQLTGSTPDWALSDARLEAATLRAVKAEKERDDAKMRLRLSVEESERQHVKMSMLAGDRKLQELYRTNPERPWDESEAVQAILQALNAEGVYAWDGDGTRIVAQMIGAQHRLAETYRSLYVANTYDQLPAGMALVKAEHLQELKSRADKAERDNTDLLYQFGRIAARINADPTSPMLTQLMITLGNGENAAKRAAQAETELIGAGQTLMELRLSNERLAAECADLAQRATKAEGEAKVRDEAVRRAGALADYWLTNYWDYVHQGCANLLRLALAPSAFEELSNGQQYLP